MVLNATFLFSLGVAAVVNAQEFEEISYATADGGTIFGNLYGGGQHAVLLAHGAIFDKESWDDFASVLSARRYRVLAIDFRGYGQSTGGSAGNALFQDVVAGIRYLSDVGAERVSVIGASMGGGAIAQASTVVQPDELDKLILLAAVPISSPERIQGDKLFIVSQGDSLRESVESQFDRAADPKELTVLSGSDHAQHIFKSRRRGEELTDVILAWLGED
jgi:pimeloyl-ACP methyl ester carboxylesterase